MTVLWPCPCGQWLVVYLPGGGAEALAGCTTTDLQQAVRARGGQVLTSRGRGRRARVVADRLGLPTVDTSAEPTACPGCGDPVLPSVLAHARGVTHDR